MKSAANPAVIDWALKRAGKTPEDLKNTVSKRVQEWIDGKGKAPTIKQLEKLAKATHVLVPCFFQDEPPQLPLQISDFRTFDSRSPAEPSPELYDVINLMLSRQDWLDDYLEDVGSETLDFVGSCKGKSVGDSVSMMRQLLDMEHGWARGMQEDAAVRFLRETIEHRGVCVCAGSYVGNSTNRPLRVSEFRGFVLSDRRAPVIFINTSDAYSAQLFTLAHEFAHLLFDDTGVDDVALAFSAGDRESDCDAVAAEFLVPAAMVHDAFDSMDDDSALEEIKKLTKVSEVVCLRRARDLGRIDRDEFNKRYEDYSNRLRDALARNKRKTRAPGDGPRFYTLQKNHLGALFPKAIYTALQSEYLLYSDAYRLTGLSAKSFKGFFEREGMYV